MFKLMLLFLKYLLARLKKGVQTHIFLMTWKSKDLLVTKGVLCGNIGLHSAEKEKN